MFHFDTSVFSSELLSLLQKHFEQFASEEGFLPSWEIRYSGEKIEEKTFEKTNVGEIGEHSFSISEDGFWLTVPSKFSRIAVKLPLDFTKAYLYCKNNDLGAYRSILELLYQGYRYRAVTQNAMMIHAAAITFREEGILFCGESGAGKSTQANLWRKYLNAKVLNYDKPSIIDCEGKLIVHGSPWSGKEDLFLNEYAPLRTIVFIEKSDHNEIRQMTYSEAFSALLLHNYLLTVNDKIQEMYVDFIKKIVVCIPIYTLCCTIDIESVKILYEELYCN